MVEFTQDEKSKSNPIIPNKPISPGVHSDIPDELKQQKRWCVWKYEWRENSQGVFKWTKPPYQSWVDPGVKHQEAKSDDPRTWSSFEQALRFYEAHQNELAGIGVMLLHSGYTGLDFDHCIEDGVVDPWVQCQLDKFATFSDLSPSNTGVKMLVRGTVASSGKRNKRVEFYPDTRGRFFTVTGRPLPGTPLGISQQELLLAEFLADEFPVEERQAAAPVASSVAPEDEGVWRVIRAAKNGHEVEKLYHGDWQGKYKTQSEADLALCNHLAFWLGDDQERIDKWFRQSGLMRDKWDSRRPGGTYGSNTIAQVLGGKVYQWPLVSGADHQAVEEMFTGKTGAVQVRQGQQSTHVQDDGGFQPGNYGIGATVDGGCKTKYPKRGLTLEEIECLPDPHWIVRRHLVQNSLAMLAGPSGAGKSYFGLALSFAVVTGKSLFDEFKVHQGKVAYIYSEGQGGLKYRTRAWKDHHRTTIPPDRFRAYPYRYNFLEQKDAVNLLHQIDDELDGPANLIIVDTLARNFGPGDENSPKDMNAFVATLDTLRSRGSSVLVVHHTGKDPSKGGRGHSSLLGACDTVILADQIEKSLNLECGKLKDGQPFSPYVLDFVPYLVGKDSDGEDIWSAALDYGGLSTTQAVDKSMGDAAARIAELKITSKGVTYKDAMAIWGLSETTSKRHLNKFTKMELLRKVPGSKYPAVMDYWHLPSEAHGARIE
jgi:hypothetical protein